MNDTSFFKVRLFIYLFFNARFLNHCLCKKFCHKFKHNIKFLSTKKFAAFLSVWLNFKQKFYLFWENEKAQVTKKVDREKCICGLAHWEMIWTNKKKSRSSDLRLLHCLWLMLKRSSFGHVFILQEVGRVDKYTNFLIPGIMLLNRAWSWDWQSCHFIHWQKSLNISKYWKTSLKTTPASMTLTSKYGFILFSCWNRQDQWCSTCQRWPYWLGEIMWLEFLQRVLQSVLFLHTILSLTGKESNGYSNSG